MADSSFLQTVKRRPVSYTHLDVYKRQALKQQFALDIPKSKIVQDEPIKSFGTYELKCKLGYEVTGTVYVTVIEEA